MYSTTQKLWEVGAKRGWEAKDEDKNGINWEPPAKAFTPWKFKDDKPGGANVNIGVPFWSNQTAYAVEWNYDATTNAYKRKNGGQAHTDLNNKKQIEPKNVIVQFEVERNANDGYPGNVHLLYGTTGTGKALFFMDGKVIEGKWTKQSRTTRTKYTDSSNKEIEFNKGQIWIQTVPDGAKVTY